MVLDNYSDMSIDELGSSLLQKKDEDARKAAKRSKKNERIQQALAVLMLGQGVMKNQYKKRAKELEDLHKFEILNNENESKQIGVTSSIVSTIGNTWKDQGGDLDSRVNSFENSDDYGAFSQKVLPFIQQKIKAATGEEYDSMYNTSAYNNAVDLATRQFARQYLENNNYKNYETQLRSILDEKDLDRAELFERGMGLNSHTLTQYEKRNYQSVLAEARAQGNLMGGFKRVLGLFNDKYKSKGGFDIFSPATEADLAGPTMRDINQALNLKGMTNNIVDNALAEASKSPTRWRERGRSKAHINLRNNVGDFQAGPIKEMVRLIASGRYPSELEGTMTRIDGDNVEDLIKQLESEPAQKEAFVLDVTALSLRLKEDRKFLQAVYQNTEGKKGKGRKSFAEFKEIMSDDSSRIQFSAMLAINEGFRDSSLLKWEDESYNSYGTLPAIYNSVGLANVLGDGINVAPNGELNLGNSYTQMTTEQKQTAIKNEADSILRSSSSDQERNVRLAALEDEVDVNFDQDMQSFLEDLATEKMGGTTPVEEISTPDSTEELLSKPREYPMGPLGEAQRIDDRNRELSEDFRNQVASIPTKISNWYKRSQAQTTSKRVNDAFERVEKGYRFSLYSPAFRDFQKEKGLEAIEYSRLSNEEKIELAKEFQIEVARNLVSTYEGGDVEKVYLDSRGKPTVGVGHLLVGDEINQYKVGDVVPQEVREAWFAEDFTKALEAAKEQNQVLIDAGHKPIPQDYLTSLNFQLGTSWYKDFKKAWAAFKLGDYKTAKTEMKNSAWYSQTKNRAEDFLDIIPSNS
tara:strand:- start:630 stop:3041 length:2412 start_codon:yes stop_codon:yes gene_type:complete